MRFYEMTADFTSALHSRYVIDGVPQEFTPAQILSSVSGGGMCSDLPTETIIDESLDPSLGHVALDPGRFGKYLSLVRSPRTALPVAFSGPYTRARIADALIGVLLRKGSFALSDLSVSMSWHWNPSRLGSMASLYRSIEAAADYIDSLGLTLASYELSRSEENSITIGIHLADGEPVQDPELEEEGKGTGRKLKAGRVCPPSLSPDSQSWIVYIPFDTSEYRLGGSLLASRLGVGGTSPKIEDADYFIDCFEVVRELCEDGILLSAAPVGEGGLLKALHSMTGSRVGADIDVSDVLKATETGDVGRLLFAEIPGVIVQVRDMDFDYLDAELILQDVAFYPLGHPVPEGRGVNVRSSSKTGIQTILESLLRSQGGEGED